MNLTKKNIQKISGTRKKYKRNYEKFDFCMELPIGLSIKPIKKHKG